MALLFSSGNMLRPVLLFGPRACFQENRMEKKFSTTVKIDNLPIFFPFHTGLSLVIRQPLDV